VSRFCFNLSLFICSDDDDSSGTDDLTVVEVIDSECSDSESDDAQCATASSAPTASSATFVWEDMMNYVGQREQFIDNSENEAQNETNCAKMFKMFFYDLLVELIVRETNTYATQKIQARGFIPLRSRMRDWKPVNKDEMYVVLALFMLMGIIQKPTLRSYFSKIIFWRLQSLVQLFLWIGLNLSAILCISTTMIM
jgi:hypothetical protein